MYNVKYNVLLLLNIWLKSIISLSSCPRCILGYILKLIYDVIFFTTYLKNLGYNIKIIAFYDSTWYVVHKNLHSPIYLWFTLISASNSLFAALKSLLSVNVMVSGSQSGPGGTLPCRYPSSPDTPNAVSTNEGWVESGVLDEGDTKPAGQGASRTSLRTTDLKSFISFKYSII